MSLILVMMELLLGEIAASLAKFWGFWLGWVVGGPTLHDAWFWGDRGFFGKK